MVPFTLLFYYPLSRHHNALVVNRYLRRCTLCRSVHRSCWKQMWFGGLGQGYSTAKIKVRKRMGEICENETKTNNACTIIHTRVKPINFDSN